MTWETDAASCPADVLEAIPWYPDGLGPAQRGALEAHAALCAACRLELAAVRGEPVDVASEAPDAERVWRRVLERVAADAGEPHSGLAAPASRGPRRSRAGLRAASVRLPLAASVALALAFGTLGTVVGSRLLAPEPGYRTATAGAPETRAAGSTLEVVFREDASAARVQEALRGIGGDVVAGPSALGVFRVALPAGSDPEAAAAALVEEARGVATFAAARP